MNGIIARSQGQTFQEWQDSSISVCCGWRFWFLCIHHMPATELLVQVEDFANASLVTMATYRLNRAWILLFRKSYQSFSTDWIALVDLRGL